MSKPKVDQPKRRGRPEGPVPRVRVPAELAARIDAAAEADGRSRENWLRHIIEQALVAAGK